MLCKLYSPVTEVTEGELQLLLGLMVKFSCPEVLGC